ncbi:hypothetical protein N5I84_05080 [Ralstonia sp. CHL-2022]|uniref:ApeA N-terminal domain 1-containing protein n=1 Tax=Ralstonia mojiangensis TaxID=2953895 RepID=UPI0021B2CD1C|nr:HEPN domain-containing protein [Ralstonia mojiangensis]MCT7295528.1 hypothetical protein [Ralstonia mojiangensis]
MPNALDVDMYQRPYELCLTDSYQFDVTVERQGNHFAAELRLSPAECSLVIRGDLTETRRTGFGWEDIDHLTCNGYAGTFFLYGLKFFSGGDRTLQRHPAPVSHFENRYRVSYVVHTRASLYRQPAFYFLDLYSPSIGQWVGSTHTQDEIIKSHNDGTLFANSSYAFKEFEQHVDGLGSISIVYNPVSDYSSEKFSIGLSFAPVLSLSFEIARSASGAMDLVRELDTLFAFILGSSLELEKIRLISADIQRMPVSLYYSRQEIDLEKRGYSFFPLGKNLRYDTMGLPQFPTEVFSVYFGLSKDERLRFSKYVRYRALENPEERFLGFFRLLEKLCYKKESFLEQSRLDQLIERAEPFLVRYFRDEKNVRRMLNRLPGWNFSKLNTAACISSFLKTIPNSLRKRWVYESRHIQEICQFRNDLTHANSIEPEWHDIDRKAKFIEALLVARLLKELKISEEAIASIVPRLSGHSLAEPPPQIRITPALR